MLGLNLLVRLGKRALAGPAADSGLLPGAWYRHLVLEALEENDFPGALNYLKWAGDPLLAQVLILRLRLLAARHRKEQEALQELSASKLAPERAARVRELLAQAGLALRLLREYEDKAKEILGGGKGT